MYFNYFIEQPDRVPRNHEYTQKKFSVNDATVCKLNKKALYVIANKDREQKHLPKITLITY